MAQLVWICLGGAVGTAARYLISTWALKNCGQAFPYGTLIINSSGSFLIAVVMYQGAPGGLNISPPVRVILATGVLGGFTTYSMFSHETMRFLQQGAIGLAVLNVVSTVFGCMSAYLLGWLLTRMWIG